MVGMFLKCIFTLIPSVGYLLGTGEALAAGQCDEILAKFAAHQVLRSEEPVSDLVARDQQNHGEQVSVSDFTHGILSADGSTALLSTTNDVQIWDVEQKRPVGDPIPISHAEIAPALTPDGRQMIAVAHPKTELTVWDTRTGTIISQSSTTNFGRLVQISPDGRFVLLTKPKPNTSPQPAEDNSSLPFRDRVAKLALQLSQAENELYLFDIKAGKVAHRLREHYGEFRAYFSKDGKSVVTTNEDGLVRWENTANGKVILSYGADAALRTVEFSPDGNSLLVVPIGKKARFLSSDGTGNITIPAKRGEVYDGAFSPAGNGVLALRTDTGFHIVDLRNNSEKISITGLEDGFHQFRFSSNGKYFLLAIKNRTRIVVFDAATAQPLYELETQRPSSNREDRMTFAEEGGVIGESFDNDAFRIWETSKMRPPAASDAKSFSTEDGEYHFYRKRHPDGSVVISVVGPK